MIPNDGSVGRTQADCRTLISLFYPAAHRLAMLSNADVNAVPSPYRQLLAHHQHMTVTLEAYHHCPVDVRQLARRQSGSMYARSSLLSRQTDQAVVQFGIVRLDLVELDPSVRSEILSAQIPLGRVLIEHQIMRQVELDALHRVTCGPELATHFGVPEGTVTYGRTALIHCHGKSAVELLEIVAPMRP